MRAFARALLTLSIGATTACYSTKPHEYAGRDSNATVVIYRATSLNMGTLPAYVAVDGREIVALQNDTYTEIQLAAGTHELRLSCTGYPRSDVITVDMKDLDWLYYQARPNPMDVASATAAAASPPLVDLGVLIGGRFMKPFTFEARTHDEFAKIVLGLERVEPERAAR